MQETYKIKEIFFFLLESNSSHLADKFPHYFCHLYDFFSCHRQPDDYEHGFLG